MNGGLETGTMVVSAVAMLGWLILSLQSFKSQQVERHQAVRYAALWVAIFGAVILVAQWLAG